MTKKTNLAPPLTLVRPHHETDFRMCLASGPLPLRLAGALVLKT